MIRPPRPAATIACAAAWPTLNAPVRLTATMRSNVASSVSATVFQSATPAFEQTMSSPPRSACTDAISASTSPRSETSAA